MREEAEAGPAIVVGKRGRFSGCGEKAGLL